MIVDIQKGNWNIYISEPDSDGHLTIAVSHSDNSEVIITGADIATETEWADRFTTKQIERDYQTSQR